MRRAGRSLSLRLFVRLSLLIGLAGLAMAGLTLAIMHRQIDETADRNLEMATQALIVLTSEEIELQSQGERTVAIISQEDSDSFRAIADWREFVIAQHGVVLFRSSPLITVPRIGETPGYSDLSLNGARWRTFTRAVPESDLMVMVAEPVRVRDDVVRQILPNLLLPFAALLAGAWACLWLALRGGLSDLRRLGREVSHRDVQDLQPLTPDNWAVELRGLVETLNRLFERTRQAFGHEQMFTAMAAHQLRTPLATVRLQAQMLAKRVPAGLDDDSEDLLRSIDRASASVEQMLRLARLKATSLNVTRVDLKALLGDLLGDYAGQAARGEMEIALDVPEDARWFHTDADILRQAVGNLIENAVRHGASGGELTVVARIAEDHLVVAVLDRGPGIPAALRTGAMEPYETLGSETGRSGLGLAIVTRAAAILGGEARLADRLEGPGLAATLTFPLR